ncbi:MAG: VOC family protein [Pseudomonadota bacterium]
MRTQLDHLVIGAADLDKAVDWATARFGIAPAARGRHALMGTHNALWHMAVPGAPDAYLEIIAIDPEAPAPDRPRWFGLDTDAVKKMLAGEPRLLTWQIRPGGGLDAMVAALGKEEIATGEVLSLSRDSLSWRLTVTEDGVMPFEGRQPIMIEWAEGSTPPPETLPATGLSLQSFAVNGTHPKLLQMLMLTQTGHIAKLGGPGSPRLKAVISAPAGSVTFE